MDSKRILEIKKRLDSTTVKGRWWTIYPGDNVLSTRCGTRHEPHYTTAEDKSIVGDDGREVLGSSEWLRCKWPDLDFMACAKQDIEFLLNIIKYIIIIGKCNNIDVQEWIDGYGEE